MVKLFTEEKVDIVEAYTIMRKQLPVRSVIPTMFNETDGTFGGLIIGHVFKNIRKSPKKHRFDKVCFPIIFFGRNKYICSLSSYKNEVVAISCFSDIFEYDQWKNDDHIVEIDAILPKRVAPRSLYE